MNLMPRVRSHSLLLLLCAGLPAPAQQRSQSMEAGEFAQSFRAAYVSYQAGQYAEASAKLEQLEAIMPRSFEVHELLGLAYAAQALDARAVQQLEQATALRPQSAEAQNNLATSLMRSGKAAEAEAAWRQALALEPGDYSASRNLARLYLQRGKINAALPFLTAAQKARPAAKDNNYDLSLAYLLTRQLDAARTLVESLLREDNSGELHGLLGRVNEEQGRYVDAANEFAAAAHLDPSEDNLFAWASELLLHRAYSAAIAVFQQGTARYPESPRLWVGLGMSYYSRTNYEPAVQALLKAADLNAQDPRCYFFLSKAYLSSPGQAEEVIARFHHYAEVKPKDAMAQFYYAMSLWKGRRQNPAEIDLAQVEALLKNATALDPSNADIHLQLGILYNDRQQEAESLFEYRAALRLNPDLAEAHFRLGRYYVHAGESRQAQVELDRFKQLQQQHQAAVDKERAEVQQFVIATQSAPAAQIQLPLQP